jgi:hypothetical protein
MGDHPSASIRFERLVIENYKAFVRGEVEFHPEATVFIGTNASGKTSLIEVLDLLNGVSGNAQPDWLRRVFPLDGCESANGLRGPRHPGRAAASVPPGP